MQTLKNQGAFPQKLMYQCSFFYKASFSPQIKRSINNYFLQMKQFLKQNFANLSTQMKEILSQTPNQQKLVNYLKEMQICSLNKITQISPQSIQLSQSQLQSTIKELILCVLYSIMAPIGFLMTTKNIYKSPKDNKFHVNYLSTAGYHFIMHQVSIQIEDFKQIYPFLDSSFIPFQNYNKQFEQKQKINQFEQKQKINQQDDDSYLEQYSPLFNFYLKSKVKSFAVILLEIILKKNIVKELFNKDNSLGSHQYFSSSNAQMLKRLMKDLPRKYQTLLQQNKKLIQQTQKDTKLQLYKFFNDVLVHQNLIKWRELVTMSIFSSQKKKFISKKQLFNKPIFENIRAELDMKSFEQSNKQKDFIKSVQAEIQYNDQKKKFKKQQKKKVQKILEQLCKFIHSYIFYNMEDEEKDKYYKYKLNQFTVFIPFYAKLEMFQVINCKQEYWPKIFINQNNNSMKQNDYIYEKFQFLTEVCSKIFEDKNGYNRKYEDTEAQALLKNAFYLINLKKNNYYVHIGTLLSIFLHENQP